MILQSLRMTYMNATQISSSIQEIFNEHLFCTITQDNFMMKINHGRVFPPQASMIYSIVGDLHRG